MMPKTKILRPAIAMIELIFAIVIIGIILLSAPMLISTAAKSAYVAIQQESINEAATQVNMIMGFQWDENDVNERYIDPILRVSVNGDPDLSEEGSTGRRLGTPEESYRTFVRSDGVDDLAASTALGSEPTGEVEDDIDDFTNSTVNLVLVPEATLNTDYIETTTIDINRTIAYSGDGANYNSSSFTYDPFTASAGTTNIKSIVVTVTSSSGEAELEKEITLRGFSCNIGGYKLEEREF